MSSAAQLAANQANAQLSTGPRTPAGKTRSAANAYRHGLSARTHIVRDDEKAEFDKLAQGLHNDLKPSGAFESVLFDQILQAAWTLARASRLEAELITADGLDPLANLENERLLQLIDLYRGRAERSLHRATSELRRIQECRLFRAQQPAPEPDTPALVDSAKVRQQAARDLQGTKDASTIDQLFEAAFALPGEDIRIPRAVLDRHAALTSSGQTNPIRGL